MALSKTASPVKYTLYFWLVLALAILAFVFINSPITHAGGIIGTGGEGGSSGSGDYPYSRNGHGWYVFKVGHHGNNRPGIASSNGWNNISDRCKNAGASQVVAYIFKRSSGGAGNGGIYSYHPDMEIWRAKITAPYPWITTASARNKYQSIPARYKSGFTFGTNVGWFCYNFVPPNRAPTGTIWGVVCRQSDGALRVNATFNDKDGRTRAYLTYAQNSGSGNPGSWKSVVRWRDGTWWNNGHRFTVPGSYVYDNTSKVVRLYVQDRKPGGGWGSYQKVDSANTGGALPCPEDTPPTGSLSNLSCDPNTGTLTVHANWNDRDGGNPRAYITYAESSPAGSPGSYTSPKKTGGSGNFTVPGNYTFPFTSKWIRLYVQDILPNGSGNGYTYITHITTDSILPCPGSVSCGPGSMTPTGNIDKYTPFNITVSVNAPGGVLPPPTNSLRLKVINDESGAIFYQSTVTPTYNAATGQLSHTFSNLGGASSGIQNGQYSYSWYYANSGFPELNQNCGPRSFWVANMPFLQVYGADVVAGGYAQEGMTSCQIDPNAGAYSWNRNGNPDWSGAGGEIAVITMDFIQGFVSRLTLGNTNNNYSQLSFANTAYADNSGNYGGKFGAVPGDCGFVGNADKVGTDPGSIIDAMNMPKRTFVTYYVKGHDVFIDGDIKYNGGWVTNWQKATDVPSFKLVVVGGNIYVDNNVSELDGLYVAMPDSSGNGGQIVTCAYGSGGSFRAFSQTSDMYDNCSNKLTVWGTFAAKNVEFNRTYSTIGAAIANPTHDNNQASEVFIYAPEMWIPNGSADKSFKYDSIVSLPPVL